MLKQLFTALLLSFTTFSMLAATPNKQTKLTVGGKNFTEQFILAEIAEQLLEAHGFNVDVKTGVGTSIARQALEKGQLDLYYEYTGTVYTVVYGQTKRDIMTDPQAVYEWVKQADTKRGLVWLKPVPFNNTYTLVLREKLANKLQLETISDLAHYVNAHPKALDFAVYAEAWERPDGLKKLFTYYDFTVPLSHIKKMDMGLAYLALQQDYVDVSVGTTTDGRIQAFNLKSLKDDQKFFPVYMPAPVVRQEILEQHPEIRTILNPLTDYLTTKEIQKLNAEVDINHRAVSEVVREWLIQQGLLTPNLS